MEKQRQKNMYKKANEFSQEHSIKIDVIYQSQITVQKWRVKKKKNDIIRSLLHEIFFINTSIYFFLLPSIK